MPLAPDFMERVAETYGKPSEFSELVFGSPLHGGQQRYAENANADVNFLLPGNSWGKTEFIARYVIYLAWFKIDQYGMRSSFEDWLSLAWKGLVASYTYPIAKESFERISNMYKNREEVRALFKKPPPSVTSDDLRIELSNGALIDWGSLDGRGRLVEAARRQVIFIDEAGHIPDLSLTFDNILFPRTMGVGGRIHLFGTPKAHSDPYLLEVYEKGRSGEDPFYYSQSGSVLENEFWSEQERERVLRNPRYVRGWSSCERNADRPCVAPICRKEGHPVLTPIGRQVLLGAFVIAGGYFFNRLHVGRMFSDAEEDITWAEDNHFHSGDWKQNDQGIWQRIGDAPKGRMYLGAFDLGGNKARKRKKKGSDPTVGFVLDYTTRPWKVVHYQFIEGGDMDWEQKYQTMAKVYEGYPAPYLLIDATGQIDSVQEALQNRGVEVEGVQFAGNSSKKFDMLRNLQLVMELEWSGTRGVLRSPLIPRLKHELDHYVLPDDDITQDHVMTLAMLTHHVAQFEMPAAVSGEVY